jgi:betaine-aldehyde dehydrogenase
VQAATAAFPSWSRTSANERSEALHAIANRLEEEQETIARLISTENGNALRTQSRGEAAQVFTFFRFVAGLAREVKGDVTHLASETLDYTRREPYGVVGAIVPWNAPVILSALKIAPAVLTGNTMVLKPAEDAPMAVLKLAEICNEVLPAGVVNLVTGFGPEVGQAIAEHPRIRKVSFTGSTGVGRSILEAASKRIAAVTLELGGKSPQLVFPDVDQDRVVEGVISAMRFSRQGQSCTAGSRLFVHDDIAEPFVHKLLDRLGSWQVGNPLDEANDAGSLVNEKQFRRVGGYVAGALERHPDALLLGGLPPTEGPLSEGWFWQPTVFQGLPDDDPLVCDEVFGPVLSITTWNDEDELMRRANASEYGLAAFVWCSDGATALRAAHDLEVGWVQVNQGGGQNFGQSYGGVKQSGLGREFSLDGMLNSYTEVKQISVNIGRQ